MTDTIDSQTRRLLIVIDETQECDRAIVYGAKQAARLGAGMVFVTVIPSDDFRTQSLFGVGDVMREEAMNAAGARLGAARERAQGVASVPVKTMIREGSATDAISAIIAEDPQIVMLVLAADTGKDGPGPLVSALTRTAGASPLPVMLVPGHLSDAMIEKLT